MRIGLDISQTAFIGGVSSYTKNLSEELNKISSDIVFFYSSLRKQYKGNLRNVRKFPIPATLNEILFNDFRIPIEIFLGDIDAFHSSDWTQPRTKAKKVTTYHDLIPIKYPQWSDPKIVSVHQKKLKLVEEEIDVVIAVSQSTKKDLIEISKIPDEKIQVIYEGVGDEFKPQQQEKIVEFRKKYNLPDKFILSFGGIGERKNIQRIKEGADGFNLIVFGENHPKISDEEMPLLYSSASVLAYPSLYEGFGLPILESFACGTPVLTSNMSSMPEIAGDAAVLVDPLDASLIKKAVTELMNDISLREDLRKRGFKRAKEFSWQKCAKETFDLYNRL